MRERANVCHRQRRRPQVHAPSGHGCIHHHVMGCRPTASIRVSADGADGWHHGPWRSSRPESDVPADSSHSAGRMPATRRRMAGPAAASHPSPPPFAVFASKVRPPAAGSGTIARTPLLNRLRTQSTAVRLVTVVAPPGYGKTTLLAQWAARDERPFAWLMAEPDDAAPLVLLRHLAVALREIGAADRSAFTALREPDAADRSDAAALLANGLAAAPEPFVLVVDDADRIPSGPAGQIVAALADAVPAGSLLVLAGRHAPAIGTARRRAGDTLLELTGRDLAFSPRDVKLYATAVRPGIEDELVGELHHRTEGWPAAVTLALRALADPNDASDATAPDPTERYVADYIRAELLAELSEEQQEFLRRTSILDTLTAPLSDAVLGSRDAA